MSGVPPHVSIPLGVPEDLYGSPRQQGTSSSLMRNYLNIPGDLGPRTPRKEKDRRPIKPTGDHFASQVGQPRGLCGGCLGCCRLSRVLAVVGIAIFCTALMSVIYGLNCHDQSGYSAGFFQDNAIQNQANTIAALRKEVQATEEHLSRIRKATAKSLWEGRPDDVQRIFMSTQRIEELPPTSVWCQGSTPSDRICKFRNLCYLPSRDRFLFVRGTKSTIVLTQSPEENRLLDLTSLDGHTAFFFNYEEVAPGFFKGKKGVFVPGKTFAFSRFHPGNIMHVLHDDFLGLYYLLKEFANLSKGTEEFGLPSDTVPFSLDHNILLLDGHDLGSFGYLFNYFTKNPIMTKRDLRTNELTCFDEIVVGQSKQANWYQYGFGMQQGPIPKKNVSGTDLREVSDYFMRQLGIEEKAPTDQEVIVLFSRERNRKILNQDQLVEALERKYSLPVKLVSMEKNDFREQVSIISRAKVAVGLHGSILILSMFLPPGSALVELYPFAVPSQNYTPYRTLANLPGMALGYRAWENKHEKNSVAYPERDKLGGGINHLPPEERQKIVDTKTVPPHFCCEDPYWLFRIYQDTIVEIDEVTQAIDEAIAEGKVREPQKDMRKFLKAPKIDGLECSHSTSSSITITWSPPWTGAVVEKYSIWVHQLYKEFLTEKTSYEFRNLQPGAEYHFWVRADHQLASDPNSMKGEYSEKLVCWTKV